MPTWLVTAAFGVLNMAFFLGLYVAIIRQNKKDTADLRKEVNGVGGKGRQDEITGNERYLTVALAMMALCQPDDRKWLAEFLIRRK